MRIECTKAFRFQNSAGEMVDYAEGDEILDEKAKDWGVKNGHADYVIEASDAVEESSVEIVREESGDDEPQDNAFFR